MAISRPVTVRPVPSATVLGRGQASALPLARRLLGEIAPIPAFTVAIVATNYALVGLPGIKFFDLMVFVAGYTLGFRRAAVVAGLSWAAYGTVNPWGPTTPALLVTVAVSETVYGFAGALARRVMGPEEMQAFSLRRTVLFGGAALITTLVYDVIANVYTGLEWAQAQGSTEYVRWVLVGVAGPGALLFSAIHVGANIAMFPVLGPVLCRAASKAREVLPWR